ncbi:MAG: T9SS type A sorting domain-containing protein [Muribaculaceae bacterium]|nr:T9SS type A sorting domain-containing protein [Muribaculaceae bacterium]
MKTFLLILAGSLTLGSHASAQWGNSAADALDVFPSGTISYGTEVAVAPDGGVWARIYHPNISGATGEEDIQNVVYEYRVQHWDKDGNPSFPAEGLLVSDFKNKSYTVVNNLLTTDANGNALLSVSDCRNSADQDMSYTAYLISPTGEMLWGEDGMPITDPLNPADFGAMMTAVPLDDGSFVFAWIEGDNYGNNHVMLQRLNKNGEKQWDQSKVSILDDISSYPYLIPSDDNTCILVFSKTASDIIYARKIDFEGSNVWGKDTRVYRGGFGTIPLHTIISVVPSGNGGALISWNDDRANTRTESAYLSYVTPDGKIGFGNVADEGDVKLGYAGWRCFNVKAAPAYDGSGFYAVWRETNMGQGMQGLRIQKVSNSGELLWGDDGIEYVPIDEQSVGYITIQTAENEGFALFHEIYYSYNDQRAFASLIDPEGKNVWKEGSIALSEADRQATQLTSLPMAGNKSWVYYWDDKGPGSDAPSCYKMGLLNIDGSFGIKQSGIVNAELNDGVTVVGDKIFADGEDIRLFDIAGRCVYSGKISEGFVSTNLPAGLYVAVIDGTKSEKIIIK